MDLDPFASNYRFQPFVINTFPQFKINPLILHTKNSKRFDINPKSPFFTFTIANPQNQSTWQFAFNTSTSKPFQFVSNQATKIGFNTSKLKLILMSNPKHRLSKQFANELVVIKIVRPQNQSFNHIVFAFNVQYSTHDLLPFKIDSQSIIFITFVTNYQTSTLPSSKSISIISNEQTCRCPVHVRFQESLKSKLVSCLMTIFTKWHQLKLILISGLSIPIYWE